MSSKAKRIPRRTVLRGLGSVSIGLPLLDVMAKNAEAQAVKTRPRYFMTFFQPNGNIRGRWASGNGQNFTLGRILTPLEKHKQDVILLSGVDNRAAMADGPGDDHENGTACLFTGRIAAGGPGRGPACHSGRRCTPIGFGGGISIDQAIANVISKDTRFKSIELGSRTAVKYSSCLDSISHSGPNAPLRPIDEPAKAFSVLFSDFKQGATAGGSPTPAADPLLASLRQRRKSILDAAMASYDDLKRQVGKDDSARLDQHLTEIRELERRLALAEAEATAGETKRSCSLPANPSTVPARSESNSHEKILPYMMDLAVMALACERTRVASIMGGYGSSFSITYRWLGHSRTHHTYSHAIGDPTYDRSVEINNWFAKQVANMFDKMKAVGIFSSTIFVYGMELQFGLLHNHNKQDWIMTGGGFFKGGRYLNFLEQSDLNKNASFGDKAYSRSMGKYSNNQLFVSCLNAFGVQTDEFGERRFGTGPIAELG
jgi:hypothetical protein